MTAPGRSASIKALKEKSRTPLEGADMNVMLAEIDKGSDRVVAIVFGTFVEDQLRRRIAHLIQHLSPEELDRFFAEGGVAGDFSRKIQLYRALGCLSKEYYTDLNIIREVRNAFAHSQFPLNFDTKEISDLICHLAAPYCWKSTVKGLTKSKELFIKACMFYTSGMQGVVVIWGPPGFDLPRENHWFSGAPTPWL